MDNKKLIETWKKLASSMSYYNAAEGDAYNKESQAREKCKQKYNKVSAKLGADLVSKLKREGNYLV